jgi:hypothetical protein
MMLKITNAINLILNKNDYQTFVASIGLLSLHCPACGVIGLLSYIDTTNMDTTKDL